jgi:hypothetical protein
MGAPFLMAAQWGGIPLMIEDFDSDGGRDVVVQSPTRGNRHTLQDRGTRLLRTSTRIAFYDQPDLEPFTDRARAFLALAAKEETQVFVHPIHGSYRAKATDVSHSASADARAIMVSCVFLADEEPQSVSTVGAGVSPFAGPEEVGAAAAQADAALTDQGLTSDAPASCLATVTAWSQAETLDSRQVYLEVASLTDTINADIDSFEMLTDLDRWELYKAYIGLSSAVVRAAEASTSESDRVFDLDVIAPVPLRTLCAQVYGGAAAEDRSRQVAQINRLRTPGLVPAGTRLKMPSGGAS